MSTIRGIARRYASMALVLLAMGGVAACDRGAPRDAADSTSASGAKGIDSVMRLAGDSGGVRIALDSLTALVARDRALRNQGHHLAHTLGRQAVAERGNLSVLGECTPVFQSGCFHGALEGYFLRGERVDGASVRDVCADRPAPGQPGYELLECWHGLGHGLMVQFAGDVRQALPLCDALHAPASRRECQDGVFMERTIRAIDPAHDADGAANGHGAGGHGAHGDSAAAPPAAPLSKAELQRLCEGVDARYQPSCWLYHPGALVRIHGLDPAAVLRACDGAPAGAVDDCYRGFGKVYLSARPENTRAMIRACRQGDRAHATDCLVGGVEYFTDLEWTIEPGIAFCRQVPADAKGACYQVVGMRLALVHPDATAAAAACRRVEGGHVDACLAGMGRTEL